MFDNNMSLCCDSADFHVMAEILERQQQKIKQKTNTKNKRKNEMDKMNIVTIVENSIITGVKYGTVEIVDTQPQSQIDKAAVLSKHNQKQAVKNNAIIHQRIVYGK